MTGECDERALDAASLDANVYSGNLEVIMAAPSTLPLRFKQKKINISLRLIVVFHIDEGEGLVT